MPFTASNSTEQWTKYSVLEMKEFRCYEGEIQGEKASSHCEPLPWATSALPLSHNSRRSTNPHNPPYVLHRWYWMPQLHTWQAYRGLWGLVVVRLSWLSGRALAAQARGVLGSTTGNCWPFRFSSRTIQHAKTRCFMGKTARWYVSFNYIAVFEKWLNQQHTALNANSK